MRRTLLVCSVMSFVMAFLGTVVGVTVAAPSIAQAQDARIRVEQFAIVDGTGADRIRLATVPGISAAVRVLAPNGTTNRVVLATGQPSTGGTIPEAAGLDLFALDGTRIGRLGTGNSSLDWGLVNLILNDSQGRDRLVLAVADDGAPSIRLLDADGTVTWSAR